jgi:hypothetical protein
MPDAQGDKAFDDDACANPTGQPMQFAPRAVPDVR